MDVRGACKEAGYASEPFRSRTLTPGAQPEPSGAQPEPSEFRRRISAVRNRVSDYFSFRIMIPAAAACILILIFLLPASAPPPNIALFVNSGGVGVRGGDETTQEYELVPGGVMSTGKYFRIRLELEKPAHLYLVLIGASGRTALLFSGKTGSGVTWIPPDDPYGFRLDTLRGAETLIAAASSDPIDHFEDRLKTLSSADPGVWKKAFPKAGIRTFEFVHE
jgi:hypothetical protein